MTLTYLTGDATHPVKTPALIMHVCNDIGGWGRGFVLALNKISPRPQNAYRAKAVYELGEVQFVELDPNVIVANMIAQHGIIAAMGAPIRYEALAECLRLVGEWCEGENWFQNNRRRVGPEEMTIHAPRLGCGLAGGSWSVIEPLIEFYLKDREVYIYDLPEKT